MPERQFIFELARELGMTVGDIERRMSSLELAEWKALMKNNEQDATGDQLAREAAEGLDERMRANRGR